MKTIRFIMSCFLFGVLTVAWAENLIPATPNKAPDYYCTWAAQNYMEGWGVANFDCSIIEGGNGNMLAQGWIRDTTVFGPRGWSTLFHPKARADLYLMFDDGEFADGSDNSFVLDTVKFPSFKGLTPTQQWTRANDSLKAKGWRALALWCRGPDGLTRWCACDGNANHWWKVDLGAPYNLTGAQITWEMVGATYAYKIETSPNNTAWTMAVDKTGNTAVNPHTENVAFTANGARYVRVTVTGMVGGWASFSDFEAISGGVNVALNKTASADCSQSANPPANAVDNNLANSQPIAWCKAAGIPYWKIDGGDGDFAQESMREALNASIVMEHMPNYSYPLNGNWTGDGRFGAQTWGTGGSVGVIRVADVVRTYDVLAALSVATTLDRVNELLKTCGGHPEAIALLNCEDEAYIAAAFGLTMGVMRHPMTGKRSPLDCDLGFNGSRQVKKRMDEVARAARWHRIGQPYAAGLYSVLLDTAVLTDSWRFSTGDTWLTEVIGQTVYQGAAARAARGLALPVVTKSTTNKDSLPFVLAGRFPNGAVAVATFGRTKPNNNWYFPVAKVSLNVPDTTKQFGIFGYYDSLSFVFPSAVASNIQVMAQDLAGDSDVNITGMVKISTNKLTIPGAVIAQIGQSAKTAGDISDPGMLMVLRSGTSTLTPAGYLLLKTAAPVIFKVFCSEFRMPPEFYGKLAHIEIFDLCGRLMNAISFEGKNQSVKISKLINNRPNTTGGLYIVHISVAK